MKIDEYTLDGWLTTTTVITDSSEWFQTSTDKVTQTHETKRERGQYYTVTNPFNHPLFKEWMKIADVKETESLIEPFAGSNNIIKLMYEAGFAYDWMCYDIEPSENNVMPQFPVVQLDTLKEFPIGSRVCVTNPPYLGKSSARRRKIDFPWEEDDLYKTCVNVMLSNCDYVAAIIPESFITQGMQQDRIFGIISLTCKMFDDTDCPVCLALFKPKESDDNDYSIYSGDECLGTYNQLKKLDFDVVPKDKAVKWKFNDKQGNIGVTTIDGSGDGRCEFIPGERIKPEDIKVSSRTFSRISGLPSNVDKDIFIGECNRLLQTYRTLTKDVFMTSFKGLRKDGKYRRRLDFKTVRNIMDIAYNNLSGENKN